MTEVAYTTAPLYFKATIAIDPATGVSTMIGAAVRADALNLETKVKTPGTATVTGATTIEGTFAAGLLPVGEYEIQVLATPPGNLAQVVSRDRWQVKLGAF